MSCPATEALASSAAYEGGTAKWWGVLDRANAVWTVRALGLYNNPTGAGVAQVRRKLTAKVPVIPTNTQPTNTPAWNYIYSRATGSPCDVTLANNLAGSSQFYVAGNLCMSNNVAIHVGSADRPRQPRPREQRERRRLDEHGHPRRDLSSAASAATAVAPGPARARGTRTAGRSSRRSNGVVGVNSTAPLIPEPDGRLRQVVRELDPRAVAELHDRERVASHLRQQLSDP